MTKTKLYLMLTMLLLNGILAFGQVNIKNGDFEQLDKTSPVHAFGWNTEYAFEQGGIDSTIVWKGKYSMHLKKESSGTGRFYQSIPFQSDRLRKFRISGAIKTHSINEHHAAIFARSTDSSGNVICYQNMRMQSSELSGSSDWKIYQGYFYVTQNVVEIKVGGFVWGAGEAWFDEIRIDEIPLSMGRLAPKIGKYIDEYFEVIKAKSVIRDSSYINQLKSNARALCTETEDMDECHFILKNITFNLNDGHSFFSTPHEWKEMHDGDENLRKGDAHFSSGEIIDGNIAYIHVPTFASVDRELVRRSVDSLQTLIQKLDNLNPKGWIIDLSTNSGGNSFAMIPGLGPLLGNGPCGFSISADGSKMTLIYNEGLAGWDEHLDTLKTDPYHVRNPSLPIAVIYGNKTASSGEATALAFRGKENCRSFGQETGGYTTRIDNCILSDSASINLASGYKADRNGIIFKGTKIPPDVPTNNHDEAIIMATEWILSKKE